MHLFTKPWILVVVFGLVAFAAVAQEDCVNGIDDDGDGLVDLNDPDCTCYVTSLDSILGDFEDMTCCPEAFTGGFGNGIECLETWSQSSFASTDYMHECDYIGGNGVPEWPGTPPSGQGAVGFITMGGWSEHVGLCMPISMISGETYSVELYVGFSGTSGWPSDSPFAIGIYGTTSCANYPASGSGCLSNEPNWFELGTQSVSGAQGEWVFTSFSITPTENIEAIAIGGACSEIANGPQYHFLDDVVIEGNFGGEAVQVGDITLTGDCVNGVELSVNDVPGATYQWYLDGVAILGGTSNPLVIQPGEDGTYTVVVDNGIGCGTSDELAVSVDTDVLSVEGEVTNVPCNGQSNGIIDLELPGDNPPVVVSWGTGQTTETITDLMPGSYSVTITDANGCSGVETFFITEPDEPLMVGFDEVVQPIGPGGLGSAEVTASGGTPVYAFLWDNGETSAEATMLEPGVHTVTITDANGCEEILEVTIHPPLLLEYEVTSLDCYGDCDGVIELTVTGGLEDYDYAWDNGNNSPLNSNLCTGVYILTLTDAAGTQIVEDFEVTSPDEIVIVGDFTQVVCEGQDAYITTQVTGGTPAYSYLWSNGELTPDIYDLILEDYAVTVTDANGCTGTDSYMITILDSLAITADISQESCGGGANGSIDISLTNGTAPYTYMWSNGFNGEDPNGLVSGTYTVTVNDAQGCAGIQSFTVSQGGDLDIITNVEEASCDGVADGSAEVTVSGGVPPYDYTWSTGATDSLADNLMPGDYTVTIFDNGGCTSINVITVGGGAGVDITGSTIDESCAGREDGSIDVQLQQGTAPIQYRWSTGATTEDLSGLGAGMYTVTATDVNGCTTEASFTLDAPPAIEVTAAIQEASCPGISDGTIEIIVNGGTTPYSFVWSNGGMSSLLTDLAAGDYVVTITDANGCSLDSTFTVDAAEAIMISTSVTSASCNGGTDGAIDLDVSGGEAPYAFNWSSGQSTEDIQGLTAGNYTVTVVDDRGCQQVESIEIFGAGTLSVVGTVSGILCNGSTDGSIDIDVTGGAPPLTFLWSNGAVSEDLVGIGVGIYSVTITDDAGCEIEGTYEVIDIPPLAITGTTNDISCNGDLDGLIDVAAAGGTGPYSYIWSNGFAGEDLTNVGAGQYEVTVTDINGCTFSASYVLGEPDLLELSILSITQPSTAGATGEAEISVSGGTEPYDIQWSNGESGLIATQLPVGTTTVVVTDENGCSIEIDVEISVEAFSVEFNLLPNACYGECLGAIDLTLAGGLPPFTFNWSNGETSEDIDGLCVGFYAVSIEDAAGNSAFLDMIEIVSPPELTLTPTTTQATCIGEPDASIELQINGGTQPYTVNWDDGSTGAIRTGLQAGSFNVTVTDLHGCEVEETIVIEEIETLDLTIRKTDIDCDMPTGSLIVEGDNSPQYPILINGEDLGVTTGMEVSGLEYGTYIIEYEVAPGCTVFVDEVRIRILSLFNVDITPAESDLMIGEELELQAVINGTLQEYEVIWTTEDPYACVAEDQYGNCLSIVVTPTTTQSIGLYVSDTTGCEDQAEAIIRVEDNRVVYVPNVFSPNGDGINDVFIPVVRDPRALVQAFRIFDRWGSLVYEEADVGAPQLSGWNGFIDGQEAQPGVFVYSLHIEYGDGTPEVIKGDLTLLK